MVAEVFITQLLESNFSLSVEGDCLKISPASRLTNEQRAAIKIHKSTIVAFLEAAKQAAEALSEPPKPCERCGAKMKHVEAGYRSCPSCHFQIVEPKSGYWTTTRPVESANLCAACGAWLADDGRCLVYVGQGQRRAA
jgi:TubC N-terminal docking domain